MRVGQDVAEASSIRGIRRPEARPVLLYVVGVGRSGTTILEALLGSHPGILRTGELRQLLEDEQNKERRCSCGALLAECRFWGEVLRRWSPPAGGAGAPPFKNLRADYERLLGWPRLASDLLFRRKNVSRYREGTASLFSALRQVSSAVVISDSSKTPARPAVLAWMDLADVRLVHLVREPRAVVWSRVKAHERILGRRMGSVRRGVFAVRRAGQWVIVNALSEILARRTAAAIRVSYEDLVTDPGRVLGQIGRLVDLDLTGVGKAAADGADFDFGHIVGGNPRRFKGPARLEMDRDWMEASPRWMRRLVWILTWPLARRYRYSA